MIAVTVQQSSNNDLSTYMGLVAILVVAFAATFIIDSIRKNIRREQARVVSEAAAAVRYELMSFLIMVADSLDEAQSHTRHLDPVAAGYLDPYDFFFKWGTAERSVEVVLRHRHQDQVIMDSKFGDCVPPTTIYGGHYKDPESFKHDFIALMGPDAPSCVHEQQDATAA